MANGNFAGGSGTVADPYLIEDAHDLNAVRNNMRASYKVIAEIDMNILPYNQGWSPIGGAGGSSYFWGNFDGGGHKIKNLYINSAGVERIGLFGNTQNSTFINIRLDNVQISGGNYTGALIGRTLNDYIINCYSSGIVTSTGLCGGLIGIATGSTVVDGSYSSCGVSSSGDNAGGLVGSNNASVKNSFFMGSVTGTRYVGGIAGYNTGWIINCYSTGVVAITSGQNIGGLVGRNSNGTVHECYWDINTSGIATSQGGIGKTTAEMKTPSTFANWDTNIWYIWDGKYPQLLMLLEFNNKLLVFNNGVYKYLVEDIWNIIGSTATEEDFINYGMDSSKLQEISELVWSKLEGMVDLHYYTDDNRTNSARFHVETEPFTFYDEFNDNFELLYFTDDPVLTSPTLEITANYSPLDELHEDFDVVVLNEEGNNLPMSVHGIPYPKHRHKIEISNPDRLLKDWTDWTEQKLSESVTLTPSMFSSYTPSTLTITVEQLDGTLVRETGQFAIFDTEPQIFATFLGNTLTLKIGDEENDKVQYKVTLNGKQIYPEEGFTPLAPSPIEFIRLFYSNEIKINQQNSIVIECKDEYGKESTATLNFIGDYSGILFMDTNGKYYSDTFGEILQYLDFGSIIAGRTTLPKKVRVTNKNSFPIKNMVLTLDNDFRSNTRVELSRTESPFLPEDSLAFVDDFEVNDEASFYVRIVTNKDDSPHSGLFNIVADAEPL